MNFLKDVLADIVFLWCVLMLWCVLITDWDFIIHIILKDYISYCFKYSPSLLLHCWLVIRKSILPVKILSYLFHWFEFAFSALALLVGHQEEHLACKN